MAIILADDFHNVVDNHVTGAVAGALPPKQPLPRAFEKWRTVSILLDGDRLRSTIDGVLVQDIRLSEHESLRQRLRRGHIGFPDMGYQYWVKNIRLENLGDRLPITQLFDGRSLAGWELRGEGHWMVRDGVIYASNGTGILYPPPVFRDFELSLYVRSHGAANGGVFLRGQPSGENRGFEIQIYSPRDSVYPTGSIYGMVRSEVSADLEERWFLMQIVLRGARCTVLLDGEKVAETAALPAQFLGPGRIGLQIHREDSALEFSDLRVIPY